ncbi:Transposase IS4 [Fragilaria crotonensis]|nr:Transposase IS4 [Fragilaria crotonensis]
MVSRRLQVCLTMRHDDFDDGQILHAVARFCKVTQEGPIESLFDVIPTNDVENDRSVAVGGNENDEREIPSVLNEDVSSFRAQGFAVDDDNEPAPENVPTSNDTDTGDIYRPWGSEPLDARRVAGVRDVQPSLVSADPSMHTALGFFLHFLPQEFFKTTILQATNETLSDPLTWDEFLRFMAILFLLGTTQGVQRRMFWANDMPDIFCGAPFRLHAYMSRRRFEAILKHLKLTTTPPPAFKHPFHPVNDIIDAFNKHTQACFSPSWVSCLDESMSVWTNMWTCPGWVFVPRKPHPKGNEYHSICCGLSGIMFAIELVQGKDRPSQIPNEKYSEHGKTTGLLMRLTESIHHSGRVVIMDSGFCVLKGLVQLASVGVYASAVIKKRRYWPKYIDGAAIDSHFDLKEIGTTDSLPGTLDGINFKVFCMKEEDYVMKLMATYGALRPMDGGLTQRSVTRRSGIRENVSFVYTEPFFNHFKFRHQVDDHNNARHSPISLEESINTKDWKIRVFTFILAVVEVNARLAHSYFSQSDTLSQLEFRRLLAKELMEFSFVVNTGTRKRTRRSMEPVASVCGVETAPVYAGNWTGTQWQFLSTKYPQHICKTVGCKKRIRTYCKCMIGFWMCPACIGMHIAQIAEAS